MMWNSLGKLKKITQRLYFGYCQGGFREFVKEKCENQWPVASDGWLVTQSMRDWTLNTNH
jgi:hypothetical protein